jgi:uncharacterized integral membrane protein
MSILHHTKSNYTAPTAQALAAASSQPEAPPSTEAPPPTGAPPIPRTRMSVAWASIWMATVVFIALIVFMLQNTRSVEISFLGLNGTLPLALAMLIAAFGGILLTLVIGTARITQLRRRLARGRRG